MKDLKDNHNKFPFLVIVEYTAIGKLILGWRGTEIYRQNTFKDLIESIQALPRQQGFEGQISKREGKRREVSPIFFSKQFLVRV